MMNKIFLNAAVVLGLGYSVASVAHAATDDLTITAVQSEVCVITALDTLSPNADMAQQVVARSYVEKEFSLGSNSDAMVKDVSAHTFTFGDSYCNFAHDISLVGASGAMFRADESNALHSDSDDMQNYIGYTAKVLGWGNTNLLSIQTPTANSVTKDKSSTTALEGKEKNIAAFRNDANPDTPQNNTDGLSVEVTLIDSDNPLLAGEYSETLILTIAADL